MFVYVNSLLRLCIETQHGQFLYLLLHAPDLLVRVVGRVFSLTPRTLDVMLPHPVVMLPNLRTSFDMKLGSTVITYAGLMFCCQSRHPPSRSSCCGRAHTAAASWKNPKIVFYLLYAERYGQRLSREPVCLPSCRKDRKDALTGTPVLPSAICCHIPGGKQTHGIDHRPTLFACAVRSSLPG